MDCIIWHGARTRSGYGQRTVDYKRWRAHRYAWTQAYGPIPRGMAVLHTCDNRACVNIEHLRLGTQAENMSDMRAKQRHHTKLTPATVAEIRSLLADGEATKVLAARFGVNVKTIRDIRRGSTWNTGAKDQRIK